MRARRSPSSRAGRFDCVLLDQDLPGLSGARAGAAAARRAATTRRSCSSTGRQDEELLERAVDGRHHRLHPEGRSVAAPARRCASSSRSVSAGPRPSPRKSLDRATAAARARDEILAVVSHDLRGPLHAISLAMRSAARRDPGTGRALPRRDRARIGARRAVDHRSARGERDRERRARADAAPIDARRSCARPPPITSCSRRRAAAGSPRVVPDEQILVQADRDRVLQVLGNLIGNSLKHAKGAPIELAVERTRRRRRHRRARPGPGHRPGRAAARLRSLLERPHEEGRRGPRARDRQGHRRPRTAAGSSSRASTARAPILVHAPARVALAHRAISPQNRDDVPRTYEGTSRAQAARMRDADHPRILELVLGRMLELAIFSVEGVRGRFGRKVLVH